MASVNKKVVQHEITHGGITAARITPIQQLRRSVMSCLLWEKEFYEDGISIADRISTLISICNPIEVAQLAIEAKVSMRLRHVPLFMARELARTKEGRAVLGDVIPHIITRVDNIPELLAIYLQEKDAVRAPAKLPNQLKKHLAATFSKFDEYQLAKYNGGSKTVSLKDALRLLHPKASRPGELELWGRVLKDQLATPDTWEVAISATDNKKAEWTRLLTEGKLGGLAMLRNLRNMTKAGVDSSLIIDGIKAVNAGRLLPINFIASANHNVQFESQLEEKFLECFAGKEKMKGKTAILVDISGSMDGQLSGKSEMKRVDVACSLAMIGREMFEDVRIYSFSDHIKEIPARRGFALRDAILRSQPHNGTDLGRAVETIADDVRLIVITDEMSQTKVRERPGYMINVASYQNGIGYGQWTHFDGWSDKVLSYIVEKEKTEKLIK